MARKPGDPVYKGIADCFSQIVRNEGVGALFKGVGPRCLIVAVSRLKVTPEHDHAIVP